MNKKEYPLRLLRDLADLMKELRSKAAIHYDIIEVLKDTGFEIEFRDKEHGKFIFSVSKPQQAGSQKQSHFNTAWCPKNDNEAEKIHSTITAAPYVLEYFDKWIDMLRTYDSIELTQEEIFRKKYQNEILEVISIDEAGAETMPFDHQKQTGLYRYLTYVEEELEKEGEVNQEVSQIVEEARVLKENIQNNTMNGNMRKLSAILVYLQG